MIPPLVRGPLEQFLLENPHVFIVALIGIGIAGGISMLMQSNMIARVYGWMK